MDPSTGLPQRLLVLLEGLLRLPAGELQATLVSACNLVAEATGADKIDAFLYDARRDSLVAVGTSTQAMSALQRSLGLNVLPLSNGGRAVEVFHSGRTWQDGEVQKDEGELKGIREALGVRSSLGVPLEVGGQRRGVLLAASGKPGYFGEQDARMAETVARWVGLVAHRAELVQEIRAAAVDQGRRMAAEELMTILAHDLRNYLGSMRLRRALLRRRLEEAGRAEAVEDVDALERTADRLEALVADILDVARLDRGVFELKTECVDLGKLTNEVARTFSSPSHRVEATVEASAVLTVLGDAARLRQCLANLVANAVQKSPDHGAVQIVVMREQPRGPGTHVSISVSDQGPGIPHDLLPHLFERYTTSRAGDGGLGLGLYLAKGIAKAHGGDLVAESEPGKGARFTLTLPAAGSGAARPAGDPASLPE